MRPSSWGCTLPVNIWTLVLNYINFSGYYMSESAYSTFKFAPHGTRFCIKSSNFQRKSEVWGWPTDWHLTSHNYRPFQFKLSACYLCGCLLKILRNRKFVNEQMATGLGWNRSAAKLKDGPIKFFKGYDQAGQTKMELFWFHRFIMIVACAGAAIVPIKYNIVSPFAKDPRYGWLVARIATS